jgi:hypothetical protein
MSIRTTQEQILEDTRLFTHSAVQPGTAVMIQPTVLTGGPFFAVTAISDSAVDTTQCDMSFISGVVNFTLPAGVTIYGNFASVYITSGLVIAYTLVPNI